VKLLFDVCQLFTSFYSFANKKLQHRSRENLGHNSFKGDKELWYACLYRGLPGETEDFNTSVLYRVLQARWKLQRNFRFFYVSLPCISIYACNETNLIHYLSSVYCVTIPIHVSDLLVAHYQEVTMYICDNWYMLYVLVNCRRAWTGLMMGY
jgi:hypothetical protein